MTALIFAIPLALLWMMLSDVYSLISFAIGYTVNVAILSMVLTPPKSNNQHPSLFNLPKHLFWGVVYVVYVFTDVVLSSLDVTRRVLSPNLPINTGIITADTGDESKNPLISALTAHAITLTPGQLVIGFDPEDNSKMLVHCLDVEDADLTKAQAFRLKLIKRMLNQS